MLLNFRIHAKYFGEEFSAAKGVTHREKSQVDGIPNHCPPPERRLHLCRVGHNEIEIVAVTSSCAFLRKGTDRNAGKNQGNKICTRASRTPKARRPYLHARKFQNTPRSSYRGKNKKNSNPLSTALKSIIRFALKVSNSTLFS
jgi:hypothetical protein